jgi:hypothetical protein
VNEFRSYVRLLTIVNDYDWVQPLKAPAYLELDAYSHKFRVLLYYYYPRNLRQFLQNQDEIDLGLSHFETLHCVARGIDMIHQAGHAHQHVFPSQIIFSL